jgi:hypothetical protein
MWGLLTITVMWLRIEGVRGSNPLISWHHLRMSYDLAVWEGERPANDREAGGAHTALYDQYLEADVQIPPTPLIVEFVERLLRRWPEEGEVDKDDVPWSALPLIMGAAGPYIYFAMAWSRAEETSAYAVQVATQLGLHCFDPQEDRLRTS